MDMLFLKLFFLLRVAGIAELWFLFFQDIGPDNPMAFVAGLTIFLIFEWLVDNFSIVLAL